MIRFQSIFLLRLSGYQLTRDIGSQFEYSNVGVGLLGHALSRRAGTDYETLVTSRICKPLEMESTRITLSPELTKRLAIEMWLKP